MFSKPIHMVLGRLRVIYPRNTHASKSSATAVVPRDARQSAGHVCCGAQSITRCKLLVLLTMHGCQLCVDVVLAEQNWLVWALASLAMISVDLPEFSAIAMLPRMPVGGHVGGQWKSCGRFVHPPARSSADPSVPPADRTSASLTSECRPSLNKVQIKLKRRSHQT